MTAQPDFRDVGEDFLEHFGMKGMHWGVRKDDTSGNKPKTAQEKEDASARRKAIAKKVAIGAGILLVVAGTAAVVYTLNKNGKLPISSLKNRNSEVVKKATTSVLREPTSIIHATRGKHQGFKFMKKGGIPLHVLDEYDEAFKGYLQTDSAGEMFRRYGTAGAEKIAVRFTDPEGRKDFAGRPIVHEVIVPSVMTSGIHNVDDVKAKIWPHIKDNYAEQYLVLPKSHPDYEGPR